MTAKHAIAGLTKRGGQLRDGEAVVTVEIRGRVLESEAELKDRVRTLERHCAGLSADLRAVYEVMHKSVAMLARTTYERDRARVLLFGIPEDDGDAETSR